MKRYLTTNDTHEFQWFSQTTFYLIFSLSGRQLSACDDRTTITKAHRCAEVPWVVESQTFAIIRQYVGFVPNLLLSYILPRHELQISHDHC